MSALEIRQFACLSDNYGYLVHDRDSGETACIDTPDPQVILREAQAAGWTITQVWNTHHHWDHAGGNDAIKAATGARIVGPSYDVDRIPGIDHEVADGDIVELGQFRANVFFTPAYTRGPIGSRRPSAACAASCWTRCAGTTTSGRARAPRRPSRPRRRPPRSARGWPTSRSGVRKVVKRALRSQPRAIRRRAPRSRSRPSHVPSP